MHTYIYMYGHPNITDSVFKNHVVHGSPTLLNDKSQNNFDDYSNRVGLHISDTPPLTEFSSLSVSQHTPQMVASVQHVEGCGLCV
jgi:hypothetical protein